MSESTFRSKNKSQGPESAMTLKVEERGLERMESLLKQSAMGIHVLFDHSSIVRALTSVRDDSDFFNYDKMKRVQDVMTALITKKSYNDKLAYLKELDLDSYQLLIRTYFHIVDGTVRAATERIH